jgi:iron complex outermembrane recepter protein
MPRTNFLSCIGLAAFRQDCRNYVKPTILSVSSQRWLPIFLLLNLPVFAQTSPPKPPADSVSRTIELPEIDISAHRSEARQLLQNQAELTGAALQATRGQSLGESLKNMTGLYSIQTGPTISKPVIHGLHSNRILILNNGVRQEGQQWGSEHAPEVDPFVASRLTVIKGAATIRYGSDAIGGVILVEPKAMPTSPGLTAELNAVGSSNGQMGVFSGLVEGASAKKLTGLSWRIQGTAKQAGYVKTPDYFLENTSYREQNFSADVHYDRKLDNGNIAGIELFYSHFATKIGLFTGAQVGSLADLYAALARTEPLSQPGFSYQLNRPYQQVQHGLLKLRAFWRSARVGTLTATLAQQQNTRQEFDYLSFSRLETPELYLKLTTHTADLVWEHRPRRGVGDAAWSGSVGFNGITQGNIRRYLFLIPNFRNYGGGLFAIERYARNRWVLEGGLRYDYRWLRAYFLDETTNQVYAKTHAWQNANGSLGTSYQARPNLLIAANMGTAWRAPNVADLYANGLHQSAVAYERGNPNLLPEQAYNGTISAEYVGKRWGLELGVFNNLIQNYIYLRPDSLPVVRQRGAFPAYSYNQVRATFRGVDATLTAQLTNRLTLTSKTSLLWAYDHTNQDYLVAITPNRTDNSIRYNWANGGKITGLYASLTGLYVARQSRVPAVSSRNEAGQVIFTGDFAPPPPAYFLVGAEAGFAWQVAGQPVRVVLTGSNLLNTRYRDYLNRFRYFADEPGRDISLKINVLIH